MHLLIPRYGFDLFFFFFSSRRRHTRFDCDWSSDVCSSDLIQFIHHSVERACIGQCFSYENYEPASGEFRVRVRQGSPLVTSSTDAAEDMASGDYEVEEADLPLKQIYQCDRGDLTKLCIRDLAAGEDVGGPSKDKPA